MRSILPTIMLKIIYEGTPGARVIFVAKVARVRRRTSRRWPEGGLREGGRGAGWGGGRAGAEGGAGWGGGWLAGVVLGVGLGGSDRMAGWVCMRMRVRSRMS